MHNDDTSGHRLSVTSSTTTGRGFVSYDVMRAPISWPQAFAID